MAGKLLARRLFGGSSELMDYAKVSLAFISMSFIVVPMNSLFSYKKCTTFAHHLIFDVLATFLKFSGSFCEGKRRENDLILKS